MLFGFKAEPKMECPNPKWIGWASYKDITIEDQDIFESIRDNCARITKGRAPCVKEFHKKSEHNNVKTDYRVICTQKKKY